MGADFGYQPPGVIGDLLWIDSNTNGVFDAGEQGIPYVTVALYSGATLIATNVTDADGYYGFGNLQDGTYRVEVWTNDTDFPSNLTAVFNADPVFDNVTSNIVISGGHVTSIDDTLVTDADLTLDFGYRFAGTNVLSGTIGLDDATLDGLLNGIDPNGVGAGETPFANVTVYLRLWNDDGDNVVETGEVVPVASTSTAINGDYRFEGLPDGDGNDRYIVAIAAPAAELKLTTTTGVTSALWVQNNTNASGITISASQVTAIVPTRDNIDFAFIPAVSKDYGDLPTSYSTTVANMPIGPSHTASGGLYLGAGVDTESNGQPTSDATGDGGDEDGVLVLGNWVDGGTGTVQVTVGAGSGWLVGWIDLNQDGTFTQANERVISQSVSSTESGGVYLLSFPIPEGTFLTNAPTFLGARFRLYPSEPILPTFFGAASAGEVEDYMFAFGILGDRVWDDLNGNGIQDPGEPGIPAADVRLLDENDNLLLSTVTDTNGWYAFTGLTAGTFRVQFVAPSGRRFTVTDAGSDDTLDSDADPVSGVTAPVVMAAGGDILTLDAGLFVPAAFDGYTFTDANANLVRNLADLPVTNMLVAIYTNGALVASMRTDADGYYAFTNLAPATYEVRFICFTNSLIAVPVAEPEASDPERNRAVPAVSYGVTYVTLAAGDGVLTPGEPINAGFRPGVPTAAAILIRAYSTADGVVVEFLSIEEAGGNDMILYLYRDGAWREIGRLPSAGEGDHRYTFLVPGLAAGDVCDLMVRDDEGQYHTAYGLTVGKFAAEAVLMDKNGLWLEWNSLPDRTYEIRRALTLNGPWLPVRTVTATTLKTRQFVSFEPGQPSGFFKIVMLP